MGERKHGQAPDFTDAALTMLGVNLLWIFFTIWVIYGFIPVLLLSLFIFHLVERVAERRGLAPAMSWVRRRKD
ncbi:hypothetical protein [Thalassococcus sp. S3]|uniref:hypothetical protein n=1 Tax=Thalassococcus sp. S3 TaxID=2017482 RepID=UPI0010248CDC|nr:hypothetical protein [Thalassococcus sp. S3]QBF31131.1 hypothetical protein CFI11_07845 [Thalassococcus sp. S3]